MRPNLLSQDKKAQKNLAEPPLLDAKTPGCSGLQAWAQDQEEFYCDEAEEKLKKKKRGGGGMGAKES